MAGKYTKEYIQNLSEDELRKQIVIPLFQAMKFTVYETHGALEFGKDLVIYSRDNTGAIIYSAVQIKTKDIHGKTTSSGNIRSIIHQCETAFEVPFIDAFDGSQKFVEKVYIVTSGRITSSATNIIFYALRKYGGIRFFDINWLVEQCQHTLAPQEKEPQETQAEPRVIQGYTRRIITGCGNIYVTHSTDPKASPLVFASLGKAGGCISANLEAISSVIGLALMKGASFKDVRQRLRGIRCPSIAWEEGRVTLSCADAIARALEEADSMDINNSNTTGSGNCPDCDIPLVYEGDCWVCPSCRYVKL